MIHLKRALIALFITTPLTLLGYTIHFIDRTSEITCPAVVDIYITTEANSMAKYLKGKNAKDAGIVAVHRNVPRGNAGFAAAWNYKNIKEQLKNIQTLYMSIVDKNNNLLMLSHPLNLAAQVSFDITRDPNSKLCIAAPVPFTNEKVHAGLHFPVGHALLDQNFMQKWTKFAEEEKYPEIAKHLSEQEKTELLRQIRGYKFISSLSPL